MLIIDMTWKLIRTRWNMSVGHTYHSGATSSQSFPYAKPFIPFKGMSHTASREQMPPGRPPSGSSSAVDVARGQSSLQYKGQPGLSGLSFHFREGMGTPATSL